MMVHNCYFCNEKVEADKKGNVNTWWHQQMMLTYDVILCKRCAKILNKFPVKWRRKAGLYEFKSRMRIELGFPSLEEEELESLKIKIKELKKEIKAGGGA